MIEVMQELLLGSSEEGIDVNGAFLLPKGLYYMGNAGAGGGYTNVILSGVSPLVLSNAFANGLNYVKLFGACSQSGTPTPDNPVDIVCNNGVLKWDSINNVVYADGSVETVKDSLNNTATAQNLFAIGTFIDEQEILTGTVARKVGAKVITGDMVSLYFSSSNRCAISTGNISSTASPMLCSSLNVGFNGDYYINHGSNNNYLYCYNSWHNPLCY